MNCPFCHCANAATSAACRVCGGPLRANKPEIAPVALVAARSQPREIGRQTFAEDAPLISASFVAAETLCVCLVRRDGMVQIWAEETDELSSFSMRRLFCKFDSLCYALATEKWVATGYENGEVRWHNLNGRERKTPAPHVGRALSLAATPTHLYSGGNDGVIWMTAPDGSKSRALIEGLGAMTTFAVSSDARLIAVGRDDGAVQLWRADKEQTAAKLDWTRSGHGAAIASLIFSSDSQSLISRDRSGALHLWAAQTSYQLPLPVGAQHSSVAPAWASDNRLLAIVNANKVAVFDVALGALICELPSFDAEITHLAFATGTAWLLLASAQKAAVWEI